MGEQDLAVVLDWRNDDAVRRNMLSDREISMSEHLAWFERSADDDRCEWLIAEYAKEPVGVVGITDIDREALTCTWSMYLAPKRNLPGIGAFMEFHVIERMVNNHNIRKIWGETLQSNRPTLTLHKRFGFREEGVLRKQIRRGDEFEDVVRVALFASDWKEQREKMLVMLSGRVSPPSKNGPEA